MRTHCCCIITQFEGIVDDILTIVGKNQKKVVKDAEKEFIQKAKEIFEKIYKTYKFEEVFSEEDIQDALDNGYFEVTNENTVYFVWPALTEL
jgi:glutathionylspermidine synthase